MYQFIYVNYVVILCFSLSILEFSTFVLNVFYLELELMLTVFINQCQLITLLLKFQTLRRQTSIDDPHSY
jgi:hypothetical protein